MDTNLSDFTVEQRQALIDLLVLAMYADGYLASNEDALIERLLTEMGYATPYDREREFDASVTRVRKYTENPDTARAHATILAKAGVPVVVSQMVTAGVTRPSTRVIGPVEFLNQTLVPAPVEMTESWFFLAIPKSVES